MVDKNKIIKLLDIVDDNKLPYIFKIILNTIQNDENIIKIETDDKKRLYHRNYYQTNPNTREKARQRYLKMKELKKKQVEDIFTDTDPEEKQNNNIEV